MVINKHIEIKNARKIIKSFGFYKLLPVFLAGIILTLAGCSPLEPQEKSTLPVFHSFRDVPGVTDEEINAIMKLKENNESFVYGMNPSTETFYERSGKVNGYGVLMSDWLTGLFDIPFKPALYEWGELVAGLESGEIHFSGELTANEERRKTYLMTDAIAERSVKYMRLENSIPLSEIKKSRTLRYAFLDGTTTIDEVAGLSYDKFKPFYVDDYESAYSMLKDGKADAFIDEGTAEAAFDSHGDIIAEDFYPMIYSPVSLTTQSKDLEPVISIVQKALDNGGEQHLTDLYNRGYREYLRNKLYLHLTEEELEYIRANPVVSLAAEFDNYPVSYYNTYEDKWEGISFDVLREIEQFTGISFKIVNNASTDYHVLTGMLENGDASVITELLHSDKSKDSFLWPETAYFTDKYALLSKWDLNNIKSNELSKKRVGMKKYTTHETWFQENFPNHPYTTEYNNTHKMFEALESGEVDLVMSRMSQLLAITNYYERPGYKVNYGFDVTYDSALGFNKDETVLCSIVDKALRLIDIELISQQWMNKTFDYNTKVIKARQPWFIGVLSMLVLILLLLVILFLAKHRERKNLKRLVHERTAKLNEALEAATIASQAKGEFLSRMSHEIRTPLNAITGMINIGKNTDDMKKKDYCFDRAENASKHLLGIINDILDMSKIEADKFELSLNDFSFEKMLINITNVINVRVEEKHQDFIIDMKDDLPRYITGDELRLSQVITNLLTNAVKFTPENGKIVLRAEKADENGDEITLRFEVTDTGIGISEEQQTRLFKSFEQANAEITQKFGGTGLGLAISKRIIELMDGEAGIESELGRGSKFFFTVKVKNAERRQYPRLVIESNKNDIRILAVDNSKDVREFFTRLLSPFALQCDVADSWEHAIEMAKEKMDSPYNLYFINRQMPGMSGVELTKRIKKINSDNMVVMMSSVTEWNILEKEALAAGVKCFISKPLFPSELINTINTCFGSKKKNLHKKGLKSPYDFSGYTVLIAEDVEINREIMTAVLEETGISIDFAVNGKEAVTRYSENSIKYNMILMDVNMPEIDGYDATHQIRALDKPNAKTIPIIAMTANVFCEDIEKCIESGMNDHIGKPIDSGDLFEKIEKHLKNTGEGIKMNNVYEIKNGLAWNDSFLLGNALVDMQHQRLFELVSDLVGACMDESDTAKLKETLDFLVGYAVKHFTDEEAFQLECGYPDYENHRQIHEDFKKEVGRLVQRFEKSGSSAELSKDVNKTLVRWLVNHIQNEDKKIGEHIRNE